MFWISCSLQQKMRTTELLNDLQKQCLLLQIIHLEEHPQPFNNSVRYSNVLTELFQIDIVGFISVKWHIYEHFHISFKFSCSFGSGKLQLFHFFPTSSLQNFRLRAGGTRAFVRFLDQLQPAIENEENKLLNDQQKQYLLLQTIYSEERPQPFYKV
jgi:hypothetical protein